MQLITNANPGEILMALFGRTATFKTVNLANNSWIELGLKTEVQLAWRGNSACVLQPLQGMGVTVKPVRDLSCISAMKYGDSVILIDPSSGRAFCWTICT